MPVEEIIAKAKTSVEMQNLLAKACTMIHFLYVYVVAYLYSLLFCAAIRGIAEREFRVEIRNSRQATSRLCAV